MQIFLESAIKNNTDQKDKNKYLVKKGEGIYSIIKNIMKKQGVEPSDSIVNSIYKNIKDIEEYKELQAGQSINIKPILDQLPQEKKGATPPITPAQIKQALNPNSKEVKSFSAKPVEKYTSNYKVKQGEGIYTIIKNIVIQEKGQNDEVLANRIYSSLKDNKEYKYLKVGQSLDVSPVFNKLNQDNINSYIVKQSDTFSKIIRDNLDIYTAENRSDLSQEEIDVMLQRVATTLGKDKVLAIGEKVDLTKAKDLIKNSKLEELKQVEESYIDKVVDLVTGFFKSSYVSNTKLDEAIQYKIEKGDNLENIAKKIQRENKLNVSFKDIQVAIQKANSNLSSKSMRVGQTITIPEEFPITDQVYAHTKSKTRYLSNNLSATQKQSFEQLKKHLSNPKNIERYEKIAEEADIPMELIIALHWRESSGDFNTYLHNGQQLGKTTTIKPKGVYFAKGEFEKAAVDALKNQSGYKVIYRLNKENKDEAALNAFALRYNGLGAYSAGKTSGYVFAGTTAYKGGKYTYDGEFNSSKNDNQLGTAVIIDYLLSKEGKKLLD